MSFTVKSGLTFEQAIRATKTLNERFTTVSFYHTRNGDKFVVRGIIKEIENTALEQRIVCEETSSAA